MFNQPFYHATFKKFVSGFGKLFSNIHVVRTNSSGTEKERIKVPLAYGPAEKYLVRQEEDPTLNRGYAIKLPRMSFEIKTIQYDSSRKLNTIKKNTQPIEDDQGNVIRQYQGVPYNLTIDLSIISKYIDDANQIIEQILPWFTPGYTITVNTIPEMNYKDDIPVVLNSVTLSDNYEESWTTRRDVIWTLSFTVKGIFYGPIVDKKIITKVQTDFYTVKNTLDLDGNLSGISRQARQTTEIVSGTGEYNEDYGYTQRGESFEDGQRFNTITGQDEPASTKISPEPIEDVSKVGRPKLS
jgi:hypothetical protein